MATSTASAGAGGSFVQTAILLGNPTLTTLVSFDGANGNNPQAGLFADAAGNLFGTTYYGGPAGDGTVFEIANTSSGYAGTPTTLASFNGTTGYNPRAGLIADAAGNLFGTAWTGGANGDGTVFEIANGSTGYASTPIVLLSFNGTNGAGPYGGLLADAAGDLFGTTQGGGTLGYGNVFEIARAGGTYASAPITLASFNSNDGAYPYAGLIADAAGNLFGTTAGGGTNNDGTVFEFARIGGGYASTPMTLASFNAVNGVGPHGRLIADAAGDLFGTTQGGGANGQGTVFEIVRTGGSFASAPLTLASFNGTDGAYPLSNLIADAAGDLFGTTQFGGANNLGSVFEIVQSAGSYASTPTTVFSFDGLDGANPNGLIADAAGNLFGTTADDGVNAAGTVFELSNSGFLIAARAWTTDAPGNFDDPTRWSYGAVPGVADDAVIDFSDRPLVVHESGSDSVHSLTNTAGDVIMAGGTLATPLLENASLMQWSGGAIVLTGTSAAGGLRNSAGANLTIAPNGQSLTASGSAPMTNVGTITVGGGLGRANIDVALVNTGQVVVTRGTLSLNGGGSSNGAGLQGGASGVLEFGPPAAGIGNTFSVTGGEYAVGNTAIDGGALDLSAAASVFFVDSLRVAGAGSLLLGAQDAMAQDGFTQGPTSWGGATGIPFLSGSGTLTVYGGGALASGTESGSGLTRLIGTNQIGAIDLDGGRTVENDGWMTWSAGDIVLGAGDPAAPNQSGTITNVSGATFYVTADGRIGNQGAGTGQLDNAGVTAVFAGAAATEIDARVDNTGFIQVQSGTLGLNGGGFSSGSNIYVASDAVLAFGTTAGASSGGTFTITGGQYAAPTTVLSGGTLDVSAAGAAVFASQLQMTAGALLLGNQSDAVVQGALLQTGGLLKGSGQLPVYAGASLLGGVQSGPATTRLYGTSVLGGAFQLDGGRIIENDGWLNWSSGNVDLGGGEASAVTHSGTITNVAGATVYVTSDGRITTHGAATGTVNNAGVVAVFAGAGETDIDAVLNDTGGLQVQSGVLGLNGGGTLEAGSLYVAPNAMVQFGTAASTGVGGAFTFTGGPYVASHTAVDAGVVDLSAVAGVSFGEALSIDGSGTLVLGGNFPVAASFAQTAGALSGTGYLTVTGPAMLQGGLETGSGRTDLQRGGSIGGTVAFDAGRSLENDGTLTWTGGTITLGGGDTATADHAATLINAAGAVLQIVSDGAVNSAGFPGNATISNDGTIMSDGIGTTSIYADLFNNGVVDVSAGTLDLAQGVGGTGTFLLDGAATLDFVNGAANTDAMQFAHPGGTLEVDTLGTSFGAQVSGFAAGDAFDLTAVHAGSGTGFNFANGTLTVSDGTHAVSLDLAGSYSNASFMLGTDESGGTLVLHT
jgi:uncharacterized repeat protein (TIGR03803 family)